VNKFNDQFSYQVIGHAMAVHRELGPGLEESFYHALLAARLAADGIPHEVTPRRTLTHRGVTADEFEADLVVGGDLIPELKVLRGEFDPEHLLQIMCYLKCWGIRNGLLLDFGKESLGTKRVEFDPPSSKFDVGAFIAEAPAFVTNRDTLLAVGDALAAVLHAHGLGYRDTSYRGLLAAELRGLGLPLITEPVATVRALDGGALGEARLDCFAINEQCALFITALRDTHQAADRARLQTCLKHLGLPWGLAVNFGKRALQHQFVVCPRSTRNTP
jgi:GxxExxY protein